MNHYERSALNFFAANPLDRLTLKRRDPAWLDTELQAPTTRFVPLWQLQNLFTRHDPAQVMLLELATTPELLAFTEPILLGTYEGNLFCRRRFQWRRDCAEQFAGAGQFPGFARRAPDARCQNRRYSGLCKSDGLLASAPSLLRRLW